MGVRRRREIVKKSSKTSRRRETVIKIILKKAYDIRGREIVKKSSKTSRRREIVKKKNVYISVLGCQRNRNSKEILYDIKKKRSSIKNF